MTDKEVMQLALDWLNWFQYGTDKNGVRKLQVIEALRTALAQPEHSSDCAVHNEPAYPDGECDCGLVSGIVAWADKYYLEREGHDFWVSRQKPAMDGVPLYTIPKREWVKLTDKEIDAYSPTDIVKHRVAFARVIEAKLKEKNNG